MQTQSSESLIKSRQTYLGAGGVGMSVVSETRNQTYSLKAIFLLQTHTALEQGRHDLLVKA